MLQLADSWESQSQRQMAHFAVNAQVLRSDTNVLKHRKQAMFLAEPVYSRSDLQFASMRYLMYNSIVFVTYQISVQQTGDG